MNLLEKIVWKIQKRFYPESTFKEIRRQKELLKLYKEEMDEEVGKYRHIASKEQVEKWRNEVKIKYKLLGLDFDKLS